MVGDDALIARRVVVVATGSGAAMPPIEGLDSVDAWNNREATTSKRIPESMIVLGGGPVGVGARPGLVDARDEGHPDRGRRAGAGPRGALRRRAGRRRAARQARRRRADRRERASGSRPATAGSRSSSTAASGSRRPRSSSRWAASRAPRESGSTRSASSPARAASSRPTTGPAGRRPRVALRGRRRQRPGAVHPHGQVPGLGRGRERPRPRRSRRSPKRIGSPRVTFTDPQVAAVGKTLEQAREAGIDADGRRRRHGRHRRRQLLRQGDRRHLADRRRPERGTIVGATFTGFETADFLHAATVAIVGEVPLDAPPPRGRGLPDPQRDLAEAPRELRSV